MSDVEWCQNCGAVVTDDGCACAAIPKPTGALTRVGFQDRVLHLNRTSDNLPTMRAELLAHDAVLRATITQQAQEVDERERKLVGLCHAHGTALIEIHDIKQQLAASQTRCRELEREIKSLTTCQCEGCDHNLEESAFCLPCMNKVQQQVTQLQTTLAELVEGLKQLADPFYGSSEELDEWERSKSKEPFNQWLAQRLLTQLEAHRKEG